MIYNRVCSILIKHLTVVSRHNKTTLSFLFSSLYTTSTTTTTTTFGNNFRSSSHKTLHDLLEKCSSMKQLKVIHAQIILHGLYQETFSISKLISFCAVSESGDLQYAQLAFDQLPQRNRHMYNSLIRGYSNSANPMKALQLYHQMTCSRILPNEFTYPFVLKVCSSMSRLIDGVIVHVQIIKLGFELHTCVQNGLINVYCGCGVVWDARKVFDDMVDTNLVSWNSMIGGYSKMGDCTEAFLLYRVMREWGMMPDEFTFVSLLSACSQNFDGVLGRLLHSYIVVSGVDIDIYMENAIVDMYAKCGHLDTAQEFFERMSDKNVVSWTSMVSAYAKYGLVESARKIFDHMPVQNVVSWNSLISCYLQKGCYSKALDLFYDIFTAGLVPDDSTLASILSACSQLGDLVTGKNIHNYVCSYFVKPNVTLFNSLIDMYAKCGLIKTSLNIFSEMPEKNIVSWNVIIGALALHGHGHEAVELFENMEADGIRPDEITFTGLLSACCHSGLIDTGKYYFERMIPVYGVPHEIEHYACMINLLGRVGLFGEAIKLIARMPIKPDKVVWGALLGACRIHGNIELGKQILKQVLELEGYTSGLYVLISNMFCEARRWEDMKKIRKLMKDQRIRKSRAVSSVEIDGHVYEFMVDDQRNDISNDVYLMLDQLTDHLKSFGYSCSFPSRFLDAEEI